MRALTVVFALSVAGCSWYTPPAVPPCAVRCGDADACPTGSSCKNGFCAMPGETAQCLCRPGEERECGGSNNIGECAAGLQRCRDGVWGACTGEARPSSEICDNKDNDCNDRIDDEVTGDLCPMQRGVCTGARAQCVAGSMTACTAADYGPDYEEVETRCDGKDNDCDGLVDESPVVELGADTSVEGWEVVPRLNTGFAVVQLGLDGGAHGVAVNRFSERFAPLRSTWLPVGQVSLVAAGGYGDSVVAGWREGNGVFGGAVVHPSGAVVPLHTGDAGLPSMGLIWPINVALVAGKVRVVYRGSRNGFDFAQFAEWESDGGTLLRATDLTAGIDAGPFARRLVAARLTNEGQWTSFTTAWTIEDGGTMTECEARHLDRGALGARCLSAAGLLLDIDAGTGGVTRIESSSFDAPFEIPGVLEDYSQVVVVENSLDGASPVITLRRSRDPTEIGASWGYLTSSLPTVVFEQKVGATSQFEIARMVRAGNTLAPRSKVVASNGSTSHPRIAPTDAGVALMWWKAGVIEAKQVCSP